MNVLVTIKLPESLLDIIRKQHDVEVVQEDRPMSRQELLDQIKNKEGLLCCIGDRIDQELLDHGPHLKVIASYGAGINHIDLAEVNRRGIPVSNTPDAVTDATADIAMALILATARRVVEGDQLTRAGQSAMGKLFHFLGCEVTGKTLGIIGLGSIGRAVAKRAKGFDMSVLYHNRNQLDSTEEKAMGIAYVPFKTVLEQADFLSLHVPLTEQTHHLIDHDALALMKPTAILINTSRGPVVDEQALVEVLKAKSIGGAGLDVYENEPVLTPGLAEMENTVLLPHLGSATLETRIRMGEMAIANLLAGLDGKSLPNDLNLID